jgi:hypothetical protein
VVRGGVEPPTFRDATLFKVMYDGWGLRRTPRLGGLRSEGQLWR